MNCPENDPDSFFVAFKGTQKFPFNHWKPESAAKTNRPPLPERPEILPTRFL